MREFKFRIMMKSGGWIYFGVYLGKPNIPTDIKTLGQYTGIKDKRGKEIYEGDICRVLSKEWAGNDFALLLLIEWSEENLCYDAKTIDQQNRGVFYNDTVYGPKVWQKEYEVIGNIYDNKELLK